MSQDSIRVKVRNCLISAREIRMIGRNDKGEVRREYVMGIRVGRK